MKAAAEGRVRIVTSTLTLTEVVKAKGQPRLKKDAEQRVRNFFKHEYIVLMEVDRRTAEAARQLIWDHEALNHKDAIHVATAVRAQVTQLDTFDEGLIKLSATIGNPPLIIGRPNLPEQLELEVETNEDADSVEDAEEAEVDGEG